MLPGSSHLALFLTTAIVLQPSTTMDVWGIRLHPWAAGAFLGLPSVELRDRVLSLDELSASLARALSGVVDEEGDDAQLAFLVRVLSTHVASVAQPEARMRHVVAHVVELMGDQGAREAWMRKFIGLFAIYIFFSVAKRVS